MDAANGGLAPAGYQTGIAALLVDTHTKLLKTYIQCGLINDPSVFSDACFSLASGIDHAIAMNEVPKTSPHLPPLLKEVNRCKNESLQAAFMVLMISIKSACKFGWFPNKETDDLLLMAKEVGNCFSDTDSICVEPSYALPCISATISRFYPKMKLDRMLASFAMKAGYGAFVADFHISRGMVADHEKLWLLVVQMDNIDTSSCIISPPEVSFLLNGEGVQGRTKIDMDQGPQLPSNVTAMLKYGSNLLQAVGNFNGQYIIVIAIMSLISSSDSPQLQDYVHPVGNVVDSDSEVIEMSSRISLKCPISLHRIKTPVKGRLCKHPQCFDYTNFLEINSRRPSWRCPHCNQPICYPDIRVDQNIVKILSEVGEDVVDVVISADGSWKAVLENKDQSPQTSDNDTQISEQERQKQCESPSRSNHILSAAGNHVALEVNNMHHNPSSLLHASETNMSAHVNRTTSTTCPSTLWQSPVETDAVSLAHPQEFVDSHGRMQSKSSLLQNQLLNMYYLQLQQSIDPSPMPINEFWRHPLVYRPPSGNPNAMQPLPTQAQMHSSQQSIRNLAFMHGGASFAMSQTVPSSAPYASFYYGLDRQQQSWSPIINSSSVSASAAPSMQPHSVTQGIATQYQNAYAMVTRSPSMQQNTNRLNPTHQAQNTTPSRTSVTTPLATVSEQLRTTNQQRPYTSGDGLAAMASENWRPSARMRGSLRGEALENAIRQFSSSLRPTIPIAPQTQGLETNTANAPFIFQQPQSARANQP